MQQRRDTAANWTSSNPILLTGEIGFETDTYKFKIGDGTTVWSSLTYLGSIYELLSNKSTDISADGASNTKYPGVKAIKDYIDNAVVGLFDYRGAYNASGNTYPTTGGSGSAGAILKGDTWVISVDGTLGGVSIQIGDLIMANTDTPGQTSSNWNTINTNISYIPEDQANKVTSISGSSTDAQYASAKLLYDQLILKDTLKKAVSDKTDTYDVVVGDTGKALTMTNSGTKTFTLPVIAAEDIGTVITFVKKEAGKVVIQANTGQYIDDSSSAGTIYDDQASELTSTITLLAISTTQWVIVGANGIWTTN